MMGGHGMGSIALQQQREELISLVRDLAAAVSPVIVKAVAVARGGEVSAIGNLLHCEAAPPARDYRKELWNAVYLSAPATLFATDRVDEADQALAAFDARFPS